MAVLAAAATPAVAQAGTYDVWSCRDANGAALSASAWVPEGRVADTCATGGSLRVTPEGAIRFAPPAGTRITGYELWRSAEDDWDPDDTSLTETVGTTPFTTFSGTVGDPRNPLANANRVVAKRSPLDAVTLRVACQDECLNARIDLYRSHVTISDTTAPTATASVAGDDAVIVGATDRGGGVAALTLSLDGGPAQTLTTGCAAPYTALQPCPGAADRAFAINAPEGVHSASGTVVDAAGNATAWGPVAITIARGGGTTTTVSPAPLSIAGQEVIKLASATLVHAPGSKTKLEGTLKSAAGLAMAGARLTVSSFDLGTDDAVPRSLGSVTTGPGGAFSITLDRDGAQRVTVTSPAGATATATVRANLALQLRSSRGRIVKGRLLTLHGKLRGAGASARGTVVTIESIVNGEWLPVGSAKAKADGTYAWRYRFVHLARDTIFSFRAVVERAPGWPWPSERSAKIKVRVDVP
jgi:hypothetical protein